MFRNILVAIDRSADSGQALEEGIDLAKSEHGRPVPFKHADNQAGTPVSHHSIGELVRGQ
jgi:nucleotide-binding universal stress UspA family protein